MIPISRITCLYLKKNGCTVYGVNIEKKDQSVSTYSFDMLLELLSPCYMHPDYSEKTFASSHLGSQAGRDYKMRI